MLSSYHYSSRISDYIFDFDVILHVISVDPRLTLFSGLTLHVIDDIPNASVFLDHFLMVVVSLLWGARFYLLAHHAIHSKIFFFAD